MQIDPSKPLICSCERDLFLPEYTPLSARLFRTPFWSHSTPFRQTAYGLPSWALFWLLKKIRVVGRYGRFRFTCRGRTRSMRYDGFNTQYSAIYDRLKVDVPYEYTTVLLLDHLLDGVRWFADVGSNWGYFAMLASANKRFHGSIHAFEPGPSFKDLESMQAQLQFPFGMFIYRKAVSSCDGSVAFGMSDPLQSGLASVRDFGRRVECVRLDSIDPLQDPRGVIKIDAEGHELEVLMGASGLLQRTKPAIVFESVLGRDNQRTLDVIGYLNKYGYRVYSYGVMRKRLGVDYVDPDPVTTQPSEVLRFVGVTHENRMMLRDGGNLLAIHVP